MLSLHLTFVIHADRKIIRYFSNFIKKKKPFLLLVVCCKLHIKFHKKLSSTYMWNRVFHICPKRKDIFSANISGAHLHWRRIFRQFAFFLLQRQQLHCDSHLFLHLKYHGCVYKFSCIRVPIRTYTYIRIRYFALVKYGRVFTFLSASMSRTSIVEFELETP